MRIFFLIALFFLLLIILAKKAFSTEAIISRWWMDFLHKVGEDKIRALVFKDLSEQKRLQFVVTLSHICWKMYVCAGLEETVRRFTGLCKSMQDVRALLKDNGLDESNEALVDYMLDLLKS